MAKFLKCNHCGNIVEMIDDKGVPVVCCGEPMQVLEPNTEDAAQEKHVPVVTVEGDWVIVNVGDVEHPMEAEHHIAWIYVETENGGQRKNLAVGAAPHAEFTMASGGKATAVYAYCNLHGLWKKDL